ncbi:ABC transporter substrate-binding protein [Pelistega indica]|uniref:ABC transporter substrate-binding protein n=1 Tax=Pelistega indica TaxID=1414851 RepID=V8G7P4_9BURK|nr:MULTISPECIES: tripartite tricarboxylate transporter substrate binding protein [Pelistega]ETD72440.1 ABC transporter substrate-binding protein [Pelistega indica]
MKKIVSLLALCLSCVTTTNSLAQNNYPHDNIHFVVPYAAGGPLDTVARLLGEKVQADLGQPVIVENKAGAGGNVGMSYMLKQKADGYTLAMGAVATMAINPWLYSNIPFDASKDFAPVILLSDVPNVLIINKEFADKEKINSAKDLFDYIKANPGKLTYASGGAGSAGHIAGELLKNKLHLEIVHAPFQGANPAKLSLLANQTQIMFDNLASAQSLIADGKVKALAVTTAKRSNFLPEVATMQELGVDGFDIGTWFGVVAPAGTPKDVIETLNKAYAKAMIDESVKKQLNTMGSDLTPSSAADFKAFAEKEYAKYKTIIEVSNIKIQ